MPDSFAVCRLEYVAATTRTRPARDRRKPIYTCIDISGKDRIDFLQGQLTQDAALVGEEGSLLAAWCSPRGRVIVTARLIERDETIGMIIPAASAEPVLKRLAMYRLRARVELAVRADFTAAAARGAVADPALESAGARPGDAWLEVAESEGITAVRLTDGAVEIYAFGDTAAGLLGNLDTLDGPGWRRARIDAGLVDIDTANAEKFTPHMLNLDRTGAVSFDKGCYTGQEVVARTEHLGRVKRRVAAYQLDTDAAIGDRLTHDGRNVGEIVNAAGNRCLAVVPVELHDRTLAVGGGSATPLGLPYDVD